MTQVLDISVRVSRVGKRDEDRLYSTENQETAARALIDVRGYSVGVVVSETNVSGAKAAGSRGIETLARRVESGESAGIVVYDFSRLSREEPFAAMGLVGRIHAAGGLVLGVADSFDSSSPMGAVQAALLAHQAHAYYVTARDRTLAGVERAIARGAYVGKTPFGYLKNEESRLYPDPEAAPIVVELFERKAAGETVTELVRFSASEGGPGRSGLNHLLRNEAYLGVARSGEYRNESAHAPLVSRDLFDRAQAARGVRPNRTGALANIAMLKGLLKCGTCGCAMVITWTQGKKLPDGSRAKIPAYTCNSRTTKTVCTRTAYSQAAPLDELVDAFILRALEAQDMAAEAFAANERLAEAETKVSESKHDYEAIKSNVGLLASLGDDAAEVIANAKAALDMALIERARAANESDKLGTFNGSLRESWPTLTIEARRDLLHALIGEIRVQPGGETSLADRVTIVDCDGALLEHREETPHMTV